MSTTSEPTPLPSQQFLSHLSTADPTPERLAALFNTTVPALQKYLQEEDPNQYLRFKRQLISLKLEYLCLNWLPEAIENLRRLTQSPKPEVARRSTMALIEFAHLPKPNPVDDNSASPEDLMDPDQIDLLIKMLERRKQSPEYQNLDPASFPPPDPPPTSPIPPLSSFEI